MSTACVAVIPAAGSGSRFGGDTPKQYLELRGQPLIAHSIAALAAEPRIERIVVVTSADDDRWERYDWTRHGTRLRRLRCGGATRAQSVRNGLAALAGEVAPQLLVLVHDAARPCLLPASVASLIDELADDPVGGLLAVPVVDTLKRADAGQRILATEPREGLWQAQTPQAFRFALLCRALDEAGAAVTDEAGAVERLGLSPRLVRGDASNLKVTLPADIALVSAILASRED